MDEIRDYYARDREHDRLSRGLGAVEFIRTLDILGRVLPAVPATVLDIGGGTGAYARQLLSMGYAVHLLDAMPNHIERVQADETLAGLASATLGDARTLPYANACADAALLLGPLYHLTSAADRASALAEAWRVLKPGGVLVAAIICRAGAMAGDFRHGLTEEKYSRPIRERVYLTGEYLNPENRPGFFTTAYFHHPGELETELRGAGFSEGKLYAVEGMANLLADPLLELSDPVRRDGLLSGLRLTENDPALLGISAHVLGVAIKSC